jgi:hypothetical protein
MSHSSVIKVIEKCFSQGENYHVSMKGLVAEVTVEPGWAILQENFVNEKGHAGIKFQAVQQSKLINLINQSN